MNKTKKALSVLLWLSLVNAAHAQTTVTHQFSDGAVARAAEINQNFADVTAAIDAVGIIGDPDKSNLAIGSSMALLNTSTGGGFENTAYGDDALFDLRAGQRNSAFGALALRSNSSGDENSAFGTRALRFNQSGSNNSAFGRAALQSNISGSDNAAFGYFALLNNAGSFNTAFGSTALVSNSSGVNNAALGYMALAATTAGANNLAVGTNALESNVTGNDNTAAGTLALWRVTTGDDNTAVGSEALGSVVTGSNNTAVGAGANVSDGAWSNATALGAGAIVNATNKVRIGNTSVSVIEGQVAWTHTSDRRLKEQVKTINDGLAIVGDLNPVSYYRIGSTREDREMGLIAQEVAAVLAAHGLEDSGMVHQSGEGDLLSLRYNDLLAPMISAIQELDKRHRQKDLELQRLEQRLDQLEKLLGVVADSD